MSIKHQDREVDGVTLRYCNAGWHWCPLDQMRKASDCADGRASECKACARARKRWSRAGRPWRERDEAIP